MKKILILGCVVIISGMVARTGFSNIPGDKEKSPSQYIEDFNQLYAYAERESSCLGMVSAAMLFKYRNLTVEGVELEKLLFKAEGYAQGDAHLLAAVANARKMGVGRGKSEQTGINKNVAIKTTIPGSSTIEKTIPLEGGAPAVIRVIDNLNVGVEIEVFDSGNNVVLTETQDCYTYSAVTWTPLKKDNFRIVVKNFKSTEDIKILLITN